MLAGTLNFYIDYEENFNELREVEKEETWFSTDVIRRLRITTHDMELSRLEFSPITENPRSTAMESKVRSYTLFAWDRSYNEVEVATFDVVKDYLDGDEIAGWTDWRVTNVVVKVRGKETRLVSERHERGMYLSDVVWGREVYSY